jgi:hypothetical protein
MNSRIPIAAVFTGALLLLCCGIVSAEKPATDTIEKATFIHYKDSNDRVKTVQVYAKTSLPRGKVKPAATPTPTGTVDPTPTRTVEPTPMQTVEPTPTQTAEPMSTPAGSDLYKLKGYKWSTYPVGFYINPNAAGLDSSAVTQEIIGAFNAWDARTSASLFMYKGTTTQVTAGLDRRNIVCWAPISLSNALAMTTVFSDGNGNIIDADIQMNSIIPWGIDTDGEGTGFTLQNQYDIRNTATHEAGHTFGLADLYTSDAFDLTMYGYSSPGYVYKRSLGYGDILGIQELYGA